MKRRALKRRYGRSSGEHAPPRRVEILKVDDPSPNRYWKVGQFGYVVGENLSPTVHTHGGRFEVYPVDRRGSTRPGEKAYLVSKARHGRGGALWFTSEALRFTKRGSR